MQQPSNIQRDDRLKVITFLNNVLRQYYTTQPEYLLKRAKQYESMCFRRSQSKQHYYQLVKEGVHKIANSYQKTNANKSTQQQQQQQPSLPPTQNIHVPGTPVTPTNTLSPLTSQPLHNPTAAVNDFLISIGLTPFPDPIPSSQPLTTELPPVLSTVPSSSSSPPPHHHHHHHHIPPNQASTSSPSTTILPINIPPRQKPTSPAPQPTNPSNPSTPLTNPTPQKPPTPRQKTQKTPSDKQRSRTRKRNSSNAGLKPPSSSKPPVHRQITPKTEPLPNNNTTTHPPSPNIPTTSPSFHHPSTPVYNNRLQPTPPHQIPPPSSTNPIQPHQPNTHNPPVHDRIYLADDIHVPIAQVYIAAASLGYRLSADIIKRLSRDQIVGIFVRSRQLAITNAHNVATINNVPKNNIPSQQHSLETPVHSANIPANAKPGQNTPSPPPASLSPMQTGNVSVLPQNCQPKNSQLYPVSGLNAPSQGVPNQAVHNRSNSRQEVAKHISDVNNGVVFAGQLRNQNSDAITNSGEQTISQEKCPASTQSPASGSAAIPATESSQKLAQSRSSVNPPTQQTATGTTLPMPCEPAAFQLLVIRLQRFQQKYRIYLKLVQENLAAMMTKRIEGSESQRKFRYMRYAIKLLTCPVSNADKITMDIIDKVECFLREYLVIYQGIALKNRENRENAGSSATVRESNSSIDGGSDHTSNVPAQISGPSQDPLLDHPSQSEQPAINANVLDHQGETPAPHSGQKNPISSAAVSTVPPPDSMNVDSQAAEKTDRNMALQSTETQHEAVAAAEVRGAHGTANTNVLNDRLQAEDVVMPTSSPHLQPNSQPAQTKSPIAASAQKMTPKDVHSEIAKSVSRVNHYVRMAVHWTDSYEKHLENEPLLRVREERIAEVCYVVESEKRKRAEQSESGKELKTEPGVMDIVKKECEDARKKHDKLIIEIGEEWKKPVVKCLLAFQSVRMPKMIVHVPGTYMRERQVTFGFERPPLGWIGIVGEVRNKFHSILQGSEGISELLEAWVTAAVEVLKEE